jgi:hypothetical protein
LTKTPDTDLVPASRIKWRDQQEALVYLFSDELAEQVPNFVRIVEVKRLSLAVIAMARLTFANMAAESGVLL